MIKKGLSGLFFSLFFATFPSGAAQKYTRPIAPKVDMSNWRISWSDGREARLTVATTFFAHADIPIVMTENTCSSNKAEQCLLQIPFKVERFSFKWHKHRDASRVGKTVEAGYLRPGSQTNLTLLSQYLITGAPRWRLENTKDAMLEKITCLGGTQWLNIDKQAIDFLPILNFEKMKINRETGVNESAVTGSLFNITLSRTSVSEVAFKSVEYYAASGLEEITPIGSTMSVVLENASGEPCQISFSVSFSKLQNEILMAKSEIPGKSQVITNPSKRMLRALTLTVEAFFGKNPSEVR